MARPTKQGVDYFSHDTLSGRTIFILESEFGNDGYAFWFKLLEILGGQEGLFYDCENPSNWRYLVAKTRVNEVTAVKILDLLASLDAIDAELWSQKIVWVQKFVDRLSDVYNKRSAKTPQRPSLRSENPAIIRDTASESTQSKVKESKEEESNISAPSGANHFDYQDLFEFYLSLDLIKHKELTPEMKNAIDTARRRCNYTLDDMKMLLRRHAFLVKFTADNGDFAIKKRGITEFFGQKVDGGTALICSEYANDGGKVLHYRHILRIDEPLSEESSYSEEAGGG